MKFISFLLTISLFYCANAESGINDNSKGNQNMNGLLDFTSIVAVAVASPFVRAYDIVTGADKDAQREGERINKLFEPLYRVKIDKLKDRDPIEDAKSVYSESGLVYIPNVENGGIYAHFDWDEPPVSDYKSNNEKIKNSKFLNSFEEALYSVDEEALGENLYIHREYDELISNYKKSFNKTMSDF